MLRWKIEGLLKETTARQKENAVKRTRNNLTAPNICQTMRLLFIQEKRRLAINNARRQWEVMQGTMMGKSNRLVRDVMPDLVASHVGTFPSNRLDSDLQPEDDTNEYDSETIGSVNSFLAPGVTLLNVNSLSLGQFTGAFSKRVGTLCTHVKPRGPPIQSVTCVRKRAFSKITPKMSLSAV